MTMPENPYSKLDFIQNLKYINTSLKNGKSKIRIWQELKDSEHISFEYDQFLYYVRTICN